MIAKDPDRSSRAALGVTIGLALAVPILPFLVWGELPGADWLARQPSGSLAFGALGALLLAADVLLPIPSTLVGTAIGRELGVVVGASFAFVGLFVGNLVGYGAGYGALSRSNLRLPASASIAALIVTRPLPILAEAVAIAAGAGRVPFRRFALAAALGNAVFAIALAASGAALLSEDWVGPALAIPLALPVLGGLALRRLRASSDEDGGSPTRRPGRA